MEQDETARKISRLRKAILDPGRCPEYHYRQLETLRRDWPALFFAIKDVIK